MFFKISEALSTTFFGNPESRATCIPYDLSANPFLILCKKEMLSFISDTETVKKLTFFMLLEICFSS